GLVDSRLVRQSFFAVELHDHVANLPDRFLGQVERIGAHVGDETNRAFADVDALVQLLRDAHGLLRTEAELARGLLLQRRRREGRGRVATSLFAIDAYHRERSLR